MAADLKHALGALAIARGELLTGSYLTSDESACDVENRLFTNPGTTTFPGSVSGIRFERGPGQPPQPPIPIDLVAGHLHYYRYWVGAPLEWWEPDMVLAQWDRVPRRLPHDGSSRPAWLAMKEAVTSGRVSVTGGTYDGRAPFGIRIVAHATASGPRSAPAMSEATIDGTIAAFHAGAANAAAVAAVLAPRMPAVPPAILQEFVAMSEPGPIFTESPFVISQTYVQISPFDERCYAGEVSIRRDASGACVELSGELFTLRPRAR